LRGSSSTHPFIEKGKRRERKALFPWRRSKEKHEKSRSADEKRGGERGKRGISPIFFSYEEEGKGAPTTAIATKLGCGAGKEKKKRKIGDYFLRKKEGKERRCA